MLFRKKLDGSWLSDSFACQVNKFTVYGLILVEWNKQLSEWDSDIVSWRSMVRISVDSKKKCQESSTLCRVQCDDDVKLARLLLVAISNTFNNKSLIYNFFASISVTASQLISVSYFLLLYTKKTFPMLHSYGTLSRLCIPNNFNRYGSFILKHAGVISLKCWRSVRKPSYQKWEHQSCQAFWMK